MSKIFITGSSDGLGLLTAQQLINEGHQVVMHARNDTRAQDTKKEAPGAEAVLIADLSNMEETKQLAIDVNKLSTFDAIIHNAGVYHASNDLIFKVNTLAPYILTCLINKPKRIIYLSSNLHRKGIAKLENLDPENVTYGDSKLYITMLSKAVAALWPQVYSNSVDPGWVPTKMGGTNAADDLTKGYQTQAWLAISNDTEALVSGKYFFHKKQEQTIPEANEVDVQNKLLKVLEEMSRLKLT